MQSRWFEITIYTSLIVFFAGCSQISASPAESVAPESQVVISTFTQTPTNPNIPTATELPPTETPTPQPTITPTHTPTPESIASFIPLEILNDQAHGAIFELSVAPDGVLWLVTGQGLKSFSGTAWTLHPAHGDILLGHDQLGRTWVTDKESETISAWDGEDWQIYGLESGWTPAGPLWRANQYATVSEEVITDERGWVWLSTSRDVRRFDGESWRIYDADQAGYYPSDEMIENGFAYSLNDMALDSVGDVWITDCAWMGPGPQGQGARWFKGRYWWGRTSQVVGTGCVEDVEVGENGAIWIGVDDALWRYTWRWGWKNFGAPEFDIKWGSRWGYIAEIELGGDGSIWVTFAPCGGASCDTGVFILFRMIDGEWTLISEDGPGDLALSPNGDGWLCAGSRLYIISGEEVEELADLSPFYCAVETDSLGRAWLSLPGQTSLWFSNELFENE